MGEVKEVSYRGDMLHTNNTFSLVLFIDATCENQDIGLGNMTCLI